MSSPAVQVDLLTSEIERLQNRVHELESGPKHVAHRSGAHNFVVPVVEQTAVAESAYAGSAQEVEAVQFRYKTWSAKDRKEKSWSTSAVLPEPSPTEDTAPDQPAQQSMKEDKASALHAMVVKKSASLRNLGTMKAECQKALDKTGMEGDPFGIPLWRKVLKEHQRSAFGDCRDGRGCDGFVAQGFQDLFLYSALWRHLDRPGVYIDLASNDWKYISNTIFADHCLQWDGICIEANGQYYPGLDQRRRCMVEKTCVAEKAKQVTFNMQGVFGGIVGAMKEDPGKKRTGGGQGKPVTMTCQTLSMIMQRYGVKHVDYMNLDVEGVELQCLQGTDWDSVTIDVIGIEHNQKFEVLQTFLQEHGYIQTVTIAHDAIFVHKSATRVLEIIEAWRKNDCQRINDAIRSDYNGKNIIPRC